MRRSKSKSGRSRVILLIVALLFAVGVAVLLIYDNGGLKGRIAGTDTFYFNSGSENVFAESDYWFISASTVGLQVFSQDGSEIYSEMFLLDRPTISSSQDTAVIYDAGGSILRVIGKNGLSTRLETENEIISAAAGENGWFAVCTGESGYKGLVTVYNDKGEEAYKWYSGEGYLVSAAIKQGNSSFTALTITGEGSRLVTFDLNSDTEKSSYVFEGGIVLDITYLSDGRILAVCNDSLMTVSAGGEVRRLYDFGGKYIYGYARGSGFTLLELHDYQVGNQGKLVSVEDTGKVMGQILINRDSVSVDAKGNYASVLWTDGITVYNRQLEEQSVHNVSAGSRTLFQREDGSALVVSAHSADVLK